MARLVQTSRPGARCLAGFKRLRGSGVPARFEIHYDANILGPQMLSDERGRASKFTGFRTTLYLQNTVVVQSRART